MLSAANIDGPRFDAKASRVDCVGVPDAVSPPFAHRLLSQRIVSRHKNGDRRVAIIAVTDATGKLGRASLQFLLARGLAPESIRPIVRDLAKARDLVDSKFDVAYGNYTDAALLEAAFSGVDKLLFISTSALGEERMLHHRNVVNAAPGCWGQAHHLYQRHQAAGGLKFRRLSRTFSYRDLDP
jgi:NAD(P)H-binding